MSVLCTSNISLISFSVFILNKVETLNLLRLSYQFCLTNLSLKFSSLTKSSKIFILLVSYLSLACAFMISINIGDCEDIGRSYIPMQNFFGILPLCLYHFPYI